MADHCEDMSLAEGGAMHEGLVSARLGLKGIPSAAEEIMVARDIILAGLTIGRFALVAGGAVVTRDVPDHGLVMGVPARLVGYVCACGVTLEGDPPHYTCPACGSDYDFP